MSRRLHQVLCDSPHLADYVEELVVYTTTLSVDETLHLVFQKLRNLERLTIDLQGYHWADLDHGLRQACCWGLQLPSMRFASVRGPFRNMNELESFLYYAQGLQHLDLRIEFKPSPKTLMLEDGKGHKSERLDPHYLTPLQDLTLLISDSIFLDWLLGNRSLFPVSHIHTLEITYPWQDAGGDSIHRLLQNIGPTIHNLSIHSPQLGERHLPM